MKYDYDPIKILNKSKFLNDAAIKCRYDLMHINRYYDAKGIKFKKNIFLPYIYHKFDRDIVEFGNKMKNSSYKDLKSQAEMIVNKIQTSSIMEKLDQFDHTSIANVKKSRSNLGLRNSPESRIEDLSKIRNNLKIDFETKNFHEEKEQVSNINSEDRNSNNHTDFSKNNFTFSKFKQTQVKDKNNLAEVNNNSKSDENLIIIDSTIKTRKNDLISSFREIENNFEIDCNFKTETFQKLKNSKKFEKLPKMNFSQYSQVKKKKIKKPKTRNFDKSKIQNYEENNLKHYSTADIKTFNNFSLNNIDPVKSESYLMQTSTKTCDSLNFSKLINQEKTKPIFSKFQSYKSNVKTPVEEFSICTYNNTQHLIKNYLLDEKQIEKIQENSKRTQTIRKITNSPIKITLSSNSLKNDKILLSDLLDENFEFERKNLNQNSEIFKTPKNSKRAFNSKSNSVEKGTTVKSKSDKKVSKFSKEMKSKISSKFKENRTIQIEKFDTFVKSLENTVKFERDIQQKELSSKVKKEKKKVKVKIKMNEIKMNKFVDEDKRLVILKNIKNVNNYIESINVKVNKVIKNVEDDIVNFEYVKENL